MGRINIHHNFWLLALVLAALALACPGGAGAGELSPLSEEEVIARLQSGETPPQIHDQARVAGYGGPVDSDALLRLRRAGADSDLLVFLYRTHTLASLPADYTGDIIPPVETLQVLARAEAEAQGLSDPAKIDAFVARFVADH